MFASLSAQTMYSVWRGHSGPQPMKREEVPAHAHPPTMFLLRAPTS